jgi:hypothetical protein
LVPSYRAVPSTGHQWHSLKQVTLSQRQPVEIGPQVCNGDKAATAGKFALPALRRETIRQIVYKASLKKHL